MPAHSFDKEITQRVIVFKVGEKGRKSARVKRHVVSVFWPAGKVLAFPRVVFSSPIKWVTNQLFCLRHVPTTRTLQHNSSPIE